MSTDYLKIKKQYSDQLYHFGIFGMKWGIRRYQNPDGSLTEEGKRRYNTGRSEEGLPDNWKDKVKDQKDTATVRIFKDDEKKYYFSGPSIDEKTGKPKLDKDGNPVYDKKDGVLIKEHQDDLTDTELAQLMSRVKLENKVAEERGKEAARPYSDAKDVIGDSARLLDATSRALPTGNGKVVRKDYSDLSDQELRNRINRLSLEESYGKLSGDTKYIKSGSERTREYLQTAGAILGIAGSAAALAMTIARIKATNPGKAKVQTSDLTYDNNDNSLQHFGILGMKWGVRRYQDANGSLTAAGKQRYRTNQGTKEVLKNTSSYDSLTGREQRKYIKSKTISSERRSMIAGAAIGASLGIGKSIFNVIMRQKSGNKIKGEEMSKIEAGFVGRTVLGGLIGAKIGQLVGKKAGKASAEASMAERGQKYTKQLLNVPIERLENEKIRHSDISDNDNNSLQHFGILGMKWGVRRYQNPDGSLTEEGKIRYGKFSDAIRAKEKALKDYQPIKDKVTNWYGTVGNRLIYDYIDPDGECYNKKYDLGDHYDYDAAVKDWQQDVYDAYHKMMSDKNFRENCDKYYKSASDYWDSLKESWGDIKKLKHPEKDPIYKELRDKSMPEEGMFDALDFCDPKNLELTPKQLASRITYGLFD